MNSLSILPDGFIISYIFIFGLCIGSFLNVVILRGLSGEDIVFARSKCPKCNNQLKWYMNIPLFSYIFLRGKCAFCKTKISIQYPLVELITGLIYIFTYIEYGFSLKTLFLLIIFPLFIALCVTDYLETVIIDIHTYLLGIIAIIASFFNVFDTNITSALIGAVFGFLFFEIISKTGEKLISQRFFGEGDSLITIGLGAIFGIKNLLIVICLSFLLQTLFAIPILIKQSYKTNKKLALSYTAVLISIVLYFLINYFNLIDNNYYFIFVIFITIILLICLKNIIADIKNKKENPQEYNLMPFGPALIYSAFISIFYINKIKDFIISYIS